MRGERQQKRVFFKSGPGESIDQVEAGLSGEAGPGRGEEWAVEYTGRIDLNEVLYEV